MGAAVTLLMAIHCHQPVGNFDFVFEQAYANAYEPFLRVLERHPGVRLAFHYSGCLLDWLAAHRPEFLARVRSLVTRGQVELLASGYYEPILPLLPEHDRQGQIARMRVALRKHFGANAQGLWLTERVWEPELPHTLARAGIRYTMVDTNQFTAARSLLPQTQQVQDEAFWDLLGYYATEYAGSSIAVFPASKRLRYWMPFQSVGQTVEFLKRLQRGEPVAMTFADDGEKFGLWPKTHRWVYEEGWLDQFFSALERARGWLATETFHDYLAQHAPNGTVYLPSGSYEEMLEWSGGHFRNFFIKYPEANAMQQKMLRVSQAIQACAVNRGSRTGKRKGATTRGRRDTVGEALRLATQELYAGQCNCAYWHGVFGGLYLSHLRRAVYHHLIAAEQLTRQAGGQAAEVLVSDADHDGCDEITMAMPAMSVLIDPAEGGTVTEWNLLQPRVNLLDTLSRRYEPYHETLKAKQMAGVGAGHTPASIHETLGVKETGLAAHLIYDDHRRSAFVDYALQSLPSLQEVVRSAWGERRLWPAGPFTAAHPQQRRASRALSCTMTRQLLGGQIRKIVSMMTQPCALDCRYAVAGLEVPVVGLECNIALRDPRYLSQPGQLAHVGAFEVQEPQVGVALRLAVDPPATLFHFPVETVSESEEGLERTYQGLCLVCLWTLDGARSWTGTLRWTVGTV